MGNEGGFPLVAFLDSDVVISPVYVKLGEDLSVFEFVDEIRDQGEGICVSDRVAIKISVVLAGSETSILFLNEEERRSLGGFGWTDLSGAKILINEFICSFLFFDREGIEFANFRDEGLVKVYDMVIGSGWGYMVCGFFGEDLSVVHVFSWESFLWFCHFCLQWTWLVY